MEGDGSGTALALGAFLDGIPEQLVLGINIAAGGGVGVSLLVAIFVSNLPEATRLGRRHGARQGTPRERILRLWLLVAAICALASRRRLRSSPTRSAATPRRRSTASPPALCW